MRIPLPKAANNESPKILALCERLVPNGRSFYLTVEMQADSIEDDCYGNVDRMIQSKGGSIQYGWQIWETLPGVMSEAEFHAVWIDQDGKFHDITPKGIQGIDRILFLPDPKRMYAGRQIDNVRIPLKDDPLIDQFIESAECYFEVTNRGELADRYGAIEATPEMMDIMDKKMLLQLALMEKYY